MEPEEVKALKNDLREIWSKITDARKNLGEGKPVMADRVLFDAQRRMEGFLDGLQKKFRFLPEDPNTPPIAHV